MSVDSDLKRAVLDELSWEPSVDAAHIGVTANAGVVTLSGHVNNYAQKEGAERAASRVKGVQGVAEEIEVRLPYDIKRDDGDIAAAAVDHLSWNTAVPADAVVVKVEKGWVTLSGKVNWQYEREAAEQNIRTLAGVIGVSNRIVVTPKIDAKDVKDAVERALHRSWYYDPDSIAVTAQGGKSTLPGNVTTWNARGLAGSAAWAAPGATAVENNIAVRS